MRLQRFLSRSGLGSRRACEALITDGRVSVNGSVVKELGSRVAEDDRVEVDGREVKEAERLYYLMNKPAGTLCVDNDELGRRYVVDLIPGAREAGCFPVGRLDLDTTGLLIITNDGELGNRIAHPRYSVMKTYKALVKGSTADRDIMRMERGVSLEDGSRIGDLTVRSITVRPDGKEVVLSVHEGRRHLIKRLFLAIGSRVIRLERTSIGRLEVTDLPQGRWRRVGLGELLELTSTDDN